MAPHRSIWLLALAVVCPPVLACVGDYATPLPLAEDDGGPSSTPGDAGHGAETATSDAAPRDAEPRDGADDGNRCAPTPPACLANATSSCINPCRVTYNQCKADCASDTTLRTCLDACLKSLATCQVPCTGDCVACANAGGSCTGSQDCATVVYKG